MNNHGQFLIFCSNKRLTSTKKQELKEKRNIIREKIRNSFANEGRKKPNFAGQGSYAMKTTIKPIDSEYDIDDGVYLNNIDTSKDIHEWEKTEMVHLWVHQAVENHTNKTDSKARCVRVIYAKNYHVDLPIYVIKDNICYIAEKGKKQWHKSDPKAINEWFKNRDNEEKKKLERLAIYLKSWKDFREFNNESLKLIGGLQLTVLAEKYFYTSNDDEEMFFKTIENINSYLFYHPPLSNPVDNYSDLFSVYRNERIDIFNEEFNKLYIKSKSAYDEKDSSKSAKLWQKVFGDDFLLPEENKAESVSNFNTISSGNFRLNINSSNYSPTEQYIEDLYSIDINPAYFLKINCEVKQNGHRIAWLRDMSFLNARKELKFIISTNIPKPYAVKWKIKNQGEEAKKINQLRGEITNDGGYAEKIEHTKYKGSHFVECYIIKGGQCIARDKIEVPIETSRNL
ncbi:MAG: hypothetical protein QX199_14015 [Methylococcaceae bacterium]